MFIDLKRFVFDVPLLERLNLSVERTSVIRFKSQIFYIYISMLNRNKESFTQTRSEFSLEFIIMNFRVVLQKVQYLRNGPYSKLFVEPRHKSKNSNNCFS